MIYILNVDGAKEPIEKDFQNSFIGWASGKKIVLFSGKSYKRIERQLGKTIVSMAQSVFSCGGLEKWQNFKPVWYGDFPLNFKFSDHLNDEFTFINFKSLENLNDLKSKPKQSYKKGPPKDFFK